MLLAIYCNPDALTGRVLRCAADHVRHQQSCLIIGAAVCILACLGAAAYATPWTQAMREARASRQFNRLWLVRCLMMLTAALWLVRSLASLAIVDHCQGSLAAALAAHEHRHWAAGVWVQCNVPIMRSWRFMQIICAVPALQANQKRTSALIAQLWVLLRMMALWGVRSRPGRASNLTSENLCRIYLAFSLGCLQPLFFLLALLLCQSSLR